MDAFENILNALHDSVGICGHCGKRKCAGRKSNSQLPRTISRDELLAAMETARKTYSDAILAEADKP